METRSLDFVAIGRAAVDFYGEQIGGRLEDTTSFAKYIGGSPTNTAIGAARLGLRTAVLSRVGDEHMGRFVRETLEREGVDVSHLRTDPDRLTALVVLGIRDRDTFPLIFFRKNCADMGIDEGDIDAAFIASARAVVTSGTHFSTERVDRASRLAIRHARAAGNRVVLDIDYRPVLWGLTGKGLGENRFVADDTVTAHLQSIVPDCDLVVGTEDEIHIAGGTTDTLEALRRLRGVTAATLVLKRGAMGCTAFPGEIPKALDDGIGGRRFEIEVYNVLGAGDAFMEGFLRGWLRDESLETCCTYANACGAMVVSRHACSPESPSWIELVDYLDNGSPHFRLREDSRLAHIHRATNRPSQWPEVRALAFDHRSQLEVIADAHDVDRGRITEFKELVGQALERADDGTPGLGALVDGTYGDTVLARLTGTGQRHGHGGANSLRPAGHRVGAAGEPVFRVLHVPISPRVNSAVRHQKRMGNLSQPSGVQPIHHSVNWRMATAISTLSSEAFRLMAAARVVNLPSVSVVRSRERRVNRFFLPFGRNTVQRATSSACPVGRASIFSTSTATSISIRAPRFSAKVKTWSVPRRRDRFSTRMRARFSFSGSAHRSNSASCIW